MSTDPTDGKQRGLTPWKPGQSGNPKGRPLGARNRLGLAFVEAMEADFAEHGAAAIETVRAEQPAQYLKVIASILPKELHVKADALTDMSDDELVSILGAIRSLIAKAQGDGETAAGAPGEAPAPGASHH